MAEEKCMERHMKLTPAEIEELRKTRNPHGFTPRNEQPPRPGSGRANERYEKAANRRAADIYVQNH